MGKWVADNREIYRQWEQHLRTFKLSDQRHKHYPTMVIEPEKLQLDVDSTSSIIIWDEESKEVGGVVLHRIPVDYGVWHDGHKSWILVHVDDMILVSPSNRSGSVK